MKIGKFKNMNLLMRTFLFLIISCTAITLQNIQNNSSGKNKKSVPSSAGNNILRDKRGFLIKSKPGPLRQIFGIFFEQWNDTKFTMNTLNNLINDNFLPENAPPTTTTTPNPNVNISTKPPPYKITRSEFLRILRRNLRGLQRLYNIELQDALKQSHITRREFDRNVSREVSKFL